MRTAYQYRLRPSSDQIILMGEWLELLRKQYNYRLGEKNLKRLQRGLSRKKKGSNRRKKAIKRVAKAHLKVANQRKDFHYKTAKKLLSQGKHVAREKLNVYRLCQSRFGKVGKRCWMGLIPANSLNQG